jgi:hypothetical protein
MIERLRDMPEGTVGFRCRGEIEREDYDAVLMPELRRAVQAGGGLRTLYLIEDLDEIEPGALWMIPGEARVFAVAELEAAKAWVAGEAATPSS